MVDHTTPYPLTPPNVPRDFGTPTTSYRIRVLLVLTSLFLFASLYVGLVAGSAYIFYWSFAAFGAHDPPQYTTLFAVLQNLSRSEERIGKPYNDALGQYQQGKLDTTSFVEILERDVLPPWKVECQYVAKIKGAPGPEQQIIDRCLQSLQLQEESWLLLCQAIRESDRNAAQQSEGKAKESEKLHHAVAADATRYFNSLVPLNKDWGGWNLLLGVGSAVLCLFLVKRLFKWRRPTDAQRIQVTEKEQPVLFAFIRRLCRDTRAPLPHRVYITPDVNAAVFYRESLLSLFLPTRKNLVIGLGLVNQLNLSEFKAVLAHEFGHFSQNSMKLGTYVYVSNRVIADVVFSRDGIDTLIVTLRRLSGVDVRIALIAWVFGWSFTGILWAIRGTLRGLFKAINFANSALSRQMEFNADLVAVSVTGSDALIHGLARLDFATDALGQAWNDLAAAADRQLYSRDLFFHQTRAGEYLRIRCKDPQLGQPRALPEDGRATVQVFGPEDTSVPKMWATHPSNYDREVNAKRRYIRSTIDERSPWILFSEVAALREKVTREVYKSAGHPEDLTLQDPEFVQTFIDEEHTETTYDSRYHGLYDHRYIRLDNLDDLTQSTSREWIPTERVAKVYASLYGENLMQRMQTHRSRQEDYQRIGPIADGAVELTGTSFQFRGTRYRAADASRVLHQIKKELEEDFDWMANVDRKVFSVHFSMARQVGDEAQRNLVDRYQFHLAIQEIHEQLSANRQHVRSTIAQLVGKEELSSYEFRNARDTLIQAHGVVCEMIERANSLHLPLLKNVTPGEPLGPMLMRQPLIESHGYENALNGNWINRFLDQVGELIYKVQRVHFKSLGGILSLQEKLAQQCILQVPCIPVTGAAVAVSDGPPTEPPHSGNCPPPMNPEPMEVIPQQPAEKLDLAAPAVAEQAIAAQPTRQAADFETHASPRSGPRRVRCNRCRQSFITAETHACPLCRTDWESSPPIELE